MLTKNQHEYEEWRSIEIAPRYEVSSQGRMRNKRTLRLLDYTRNSSGYMYVKLPTLFGTKLTLVARQVLIAYTPILNTKAIAAYRDNDKANLRLDNLYWNDHTALCKEQWHTGKMNERKQRFFTQEETQRGLQAVKRYWFKWRLKNKKGRRNEKLEMVR